jgi:TorA maturation chaperone TorD
MEAAARIQMHRPIPAEEQARADFYALLARLFHEAPDAKLLGTLAISGEMSGDGDPALSKAWNELVAASAVMDPEALREEFQTLFEGMGHAQVSIYSAYYVGATAVDHPRVRLRADLADLHLAKPDRVVEPDDHFAALFDVMRILVAGGAGRSPAAIAEQKAFFEAHVEPGAAKFFTAVAAAGSANFYRRAAALGLAFMTIESESFRLG